MFRPKHQSKKELISITFHATLILIVKNIKENAPFAQTF